MTYTGITLPSLLPNFEY